MGTHGWVTGYTPCDEPEYVITVLVEGGSSAAQVAARELREETGYSAETVKYLGKINTSVAYSEEVIHIYAMTGLSAGQQDLDDDEAINVVEMPFEDACRMASGKLSF